MRFADGDWKSPLRFVVLALLVIRQGLPGDRKSPLLELSISRLRQGEAISNRL